VSVTAAPANRTVARNFLALGSGEVLARVIAFAATAYIARVLGPSFYGIIGFATAVTLYLNRVADGGLELGLGVREIAAAPHRLQELAPALLTARLLVACGLVVIALLIGVFLLPQPDGVIVGLYSLTLLAVGASSRWIYLGMERARLVAFARAVGETAMVLLVLLLVHNTGDLADVPLAQFAGDSVAALLLLVVLRRRGLNLRPTMRWSVIKPLLPRASSLVASSFFGLAIYNSDLVFLRFFRDTAAVGYYAAAYTLISFLINLGIAYSMSLLPTFTRLTQNPTEQRELYQSAMAQVFALGFPIALGGMLLAPAIIALFFGPSYAPSVVPFQILFWAVPLSALKDVPIVALMSCGKEKTILRQTAWAAGLNLALNLALIPRFGMMGAAVATVITETIRMVMAFVEVRREGFQVASFARLSRPLIAGVVMAALLVLFRPPMLALGLLLGVFAYGLSLTLLGGIRFRRGALPALHV
jgi:O-antigen/teichoic acid export membrane protein